MNHRHTYVETLLIPLVLLALSACSSQRAVPSRAARDEAFERTHRAASTAFARGAYEQAADFYRQALEHAYRRDDGVAIVDTQYNLAVVLLRLGSLSEAHTVVDAAKAEFARANQAVPVSLSLLEATLLYRSGQTAAAWRLSDQILTRAPADAAVIARAQFLRGLMAAARTDTARLREAVAAMDAVATTSRLELRADRDELRGYLALAEGQWGIAVQAFDAAAGHRRTSLDYAGMVRALAKAGDAAARRRDPRTAGVFYLRAGRSAALQGQTQAALDWLRRTQSLARQSGDTRTLQDVMAFLALLRARQHGPDG
jgi:tetratricopeptide (TPR) repeat protein